MTHFRFRYKKVGYMRWRCRTAQRRAFMMVLALVAALHNAPHTATWQRAAPAFVPAASAVAVLQVGQFVVSAEGDPQLTGHPDIRY
ncbi:MAG: hypothetical protein JWR44_2596 [Hymenobacter sp.]|jgi:hypothetical protein|nr:hypothetical protein [Hymenobacter sp.]